VLNGTWRNLGKVNRKGGGKHRKGLWKHRMLGPNPTLHFLIERL